MTVKLAVLKSGEDVIADIKEMVVGENENQKLIGYFFDKPCVAKLLKTNKSTDDSKSFEVSIFPWCPMSKDTSIPIPLDWVVTLVEPIDKLKEMYESNVLMYGKENNQSFGFNESTNFSQSD